jgi:three-Cys-motif partner protein
MDKFSALKATDDGLHMPTIGRWGCDKYRLVQLYAELFTASMKRQWNERVYIDLFSGAGLSRVDQTGEIYKGSPLIALSLKNPFTRYVLCEEDPECLVALRTRVSRQAPEAKVAFIAGDANALVSEIISNVPRFSKGYTGLTFCFVDPFCIRSVRFDTIRQLAENLYVDFLILLPTHMDAGRNIMHYEREEDPTLDDFFGDPNWRAAWKAASAGKTSIDLFIVDYFGARMQTLGYIYPGADRTQLIRNYEKNAPLYRLALFSRSELANKFWKEVKKYCSDQTAFGFF